MRKLLIISFDAVGDMEYPLLLRRPAFARLVAGAQVHRAVPSLYPTNTYPVHCSIATGQMPVRHGLVGNTDPFPARHPRWWYQARRLKAKTLWQAAAQKGLCTAAVMWPVTAGAKEIRYNIPELMAQPGENQLRLNLKYGSKLLQAHMFLRYGKLLKGIAQPDRDYFTAACMAHVLRHRAPELALMHLTAYDSLCHEHGRGSPKLEAAYEALDKNLALLLQAAAGRYDVLLFSDHAQLPVHAPLLPNSLLEARGLLNKDENGDYIPGDCFFECAGGSAFLHPGGLADAQVEELRQAVQAQAGFGRLLTPEEMRVCGRQGLPFGFAAHPGWACEAFESGEKANHGYPVDYADYRVFYLWHGAGNKPGEVQGGSLLDVTRLAAEALQLDMDIDPDY